MHNEMDDSKGLRKKALLAIDSNQGMRNFIDSGAFNQVIEKYDVALLLLSAVRPISGFKEYRVINMNVRSRAKFRWLTFYVSMKRYARRCSTFPMKYYETFFKHLSFSRKIIVSIVSLPGCAEILNKAVEVHLGTVSEINQAMDDFRPDLVIVPCAFNDMFSLDVIKSAKKKRIKTFALMFNWDNVSSKGVLPFLPDYMSVWGQQTFRHAVRIQRMPKENVFVLGVPQFEVYKKPPQILKSEFRNQQDLPLDKKIILFAGMSRYSDEIALLTLIDQAIEDKELMGVHFLYRPHPWRDMRPNEPSFFEMGFKHISMDHQVRDQYKQLKSNDKNGKKNTVNFVPDYQYYPSLLASVDGVITAGTTLTVEAMVAGKPVLIKAYPDEDKKYWAHKLIVAYAHHDSWDKMPSVIITMKKENFISDVQRLLKMSDEIGIEKRLKKEIQEIAFDDGQEYATRLLKTIDNLLAQETVGVA